MKKNIKIAIALLALALTFGCTNGNEIKEEKNNIKIIDQSSPLPSPTINKIQTTSIPNKIITVEEAIKLVQEKCKCGYGKEPIKVDSIDYNDFSTYAVAEKKDENNNYVIAIRRVRDTVIEDWIHVNPQTKKMTSENGIYEVE